jgi:hypothetical protein
MIKKFKNLFKKMGHAYVEGMEQFYAPIIKYNINPFI